jgi:transposase InsO family protein
VEHMTLGVDVACRAAHQASLADSTGRLAWTGRRFRTTVHALQSLWKSLPADVHVTVVMEPTRNAWVPLAVWFSRHGAPVILVPPEQAADLQDYYTKHVKSDRLDSRMPARLPLLHPEGLRSSEGNGYRSLPWRDLCAELGIGHTRTRPYHPATNGTVERFNRTLNDEWARVRVYRRNQDRTRALDRWLQPLQPSPLPHIPRRKSGRLQWDE